MKNEPALFTGLVVALLGAAFHWLDLPTLDTDTAEAVATALVTLVGALVVRAKVMPMRTLNEAGLTSEDVHARAESPAVHPVKEP